MKRPIFLNDCFYHVFNRGVDKRDVFTDEQDYQRFIFSMEGFNDENSTLNFYRRLNKGNSNSLKPIAKELLVEIARYCLMPNHFHFILRQVKESGISIFMHKLGTGFTNYFNKKYERSGALFQGKFKAIPIERDEYLNYLIQYIDLNPIDLIESDWKEKGLKNWNKCKEFLNSYLWASCGNYNKYDEFFDNHSSENFKEIERLIIE